MGWRLGKNLPTKDKITKPAITAPIMSSGDIGLHMPRTEFTGLRDFRVGQVA